MHIDKVVTWTRTVFLRIDIGIISVDEDVGTSLS